MKIIRREEVIEIKKTRILCVQQNTYLALPLVLKSKVFFIKQIAITEKRNAKRKCFPALNYACKDRQAISSCSVCVDLLLCQLIGASMFIYTPGDPSARREVSARCTVQLQSDCENATILRILLKIKVFITSGLMKRLTSSSRETCLL